jgi:hypothetical protein
VLCRTNAAAVQTLLSAIGEGKRPHLIGGGDEVLKFVNAARDLQRGKTTQHPELCSFESWGEVKAYSKTDEGEDLKLMVDLIEKFGADKIAAALKNMPAERDADLVISTAHKSKGREWNTVKLAGDFKPLSKMDDEEIRLLYVAATRAKLVLDVESCPPFCGGGQPMDEEDEDDTWRPRRPERMVDLTEARRLSKLVGDAPAVTVEAPKQEDTPTSAPMPATNGDGNGKRPDVNTWSKSKQGEWCVRGKPGQTGSVTVVRRDGSRSQAKLGKVIWQDAEVALYAVVR